MNDLLITIQKAAHIFGLSSPDEKQISDVIRQIQHQGYVTHEDMLQLTNLIPGAYKILADYLRWTPAELRAQIETGLYAAEFFFVQFNHAIISRYPAAAGLDEEEWQAVKGKYPMMADWVGRKLNWIMK